MLAETLKQVINNLRIWQRGDQRAPHKPLLLLYALGRVSRGEPRKMQYELVKDDLKRLLTEFGPPRTVHSSSYPFIRLSNDRALDSNMPIWEISGLESLKTNKDWTERELVDNQTEGGFTEEVYNLLKEDHNLIRELATSILNNNFPSTLHEDILVQVGLVFEPTGKATRSPDFRDRILKAYEYSCAVCGFDVRLGDTLVAVEAAYIKW